MQKLIWFSLMFSMGCRFNQPRHDAPCQADNDCASESICFEQTCHLTAQDESQCPPTHPDFNPVAMVCEDTSRGLKFSSVHSVGLNSSSCEGSQGDAVLRMVLMSTNNTVITPQTKLLDKPLNFTSQSMTFMESALFEMPNVLCAAGQCEDASAMCGATSESKPELHRCFMEETLSVGSEPAFVADLAKHQLFGMVIENTGSLSGSLPESFSRLSPDLNGDLRGEQVVELLSLRPERASDAARRRSSAFGVMVSSWISAQSDASRRKVETYFGAWTFANSTASVRPLMDDVWTSSGDAARTGISKIFAGQAERQQASVFESTAHILSDVTGFADPRFVDYDKTLMLFVDGPDELRLKGKTVQTVIDAAKATNTRVFVVHIDPEIELETSDGKPLIVDDPLYVEEQDGCLDDSACKGFEQCRQITRFSTEPGEPVTIPADERVALNFCLPKRDENGRIGPIEDYAQLACATGGGYIYLSNTEDLSNQSKVLPFVMDGLWEVSINSEALSRQMSATIQPYLVQTTLQLSLGRDVTNFYSQRGTVNLQDNRMVIFAK